MNFSHSFYAFVFLLRIFRFWDPFQKHYSIECFCCVPVGREILFVFYPCVCVYVFMEITKWFHRYVSVQRHSHVRLHQPYLCVSELKMFMCLLSTPRVVPLVFFVLVCLLAMEWNKKVRCDYRTWMEISFGVLSHLWTWTERVRRCFICKSVK